VVAKGTVILHVWNAPPHRENHLKRRHILSNTDGETNSFWKTRCTRNKFTVHNIAVRQGRLCGAIFPSIWRNDLLARR
jgi:hypothetical protein